MEELLRSVGVMADSENTLEKEAGQGKKGT